MCILRRLAAVAALLAAMFGSPSAHAANIYVVPRPWGGSYIFIKGQIVQGDEQTFASLYPPEPIYVRPFGPGGYVPTALAIGDIIAERGYSTVVQKRFHSCASHGQDDMACNLMIAEHLRKYGFTELQALALADAAPHETTRLGTQAWAAYLGFRWQTLPTWSLGSGDSCTARFCIGVP